MGNVVEFAKGAWKDAADAVRTAEEALKVGAVAGGLSMGILFPLDVKKTLRQASTATSSKALLAVERGQKNPFAGLLPGLMAQLPAAVLTFGAYSAIVNWIQKRQENPINRVQVVMAACLSDAIGSLWVTPLEILKQRVRHRSRSTLSTFSLQGLSSLPLNGSSSSSRSTGSERSVPERALCVGRHAGRSRTCRRLPRFLQRRCA